MGEFDKLPDLSVSKPVRSCFKFSVVLWNESRILMRILYKSKNQLRNWKSYHKVIEVQRYLKRIAVMEIWFNTTPLNSFEEVRGFVGYMGTFCKLLEACKKICRSSFFHQDSILKKGLFVQQSLAIAAIIARMNAVLSKLLPESTRETNKALIKLADHSLRAKIKDEFGFIEGADEGEDEGPDDIVVSSNIKDQKFKLEVVDRKLKKPKATKTGDEIDDIFGF